MPAILAPGAVPGAGELNAAQRPGFAPRPACGARLAWPGAFCRRLAAEVYNGNNNRSMTMVPNPQPHWREHGVRIVRHDQLDPNTPQTPGMTRAAAVTRALAGAERLWAGTVSIQPNAKTGPHHHGE